MIRFFKLEQFTGRTESQLGNGITYVAFRQGGCYVMAWDLSVNQPCWKCKVSSKDFLKIKNT